MLTEVTWWVGGVLAALVQVGSRWIEISFEFNNVILKGIAAAIANAARVFEFLYLYAGLVSRFKRKERQKLLVSRDYVHSIHELLRCPT
ncbi:MAG: hypothetical protein ACKVP2_03950 [Burkholderiales bacterium]